MIVTKWTRGALNVGRGGAEVWISCIPFNTLNRFISSKEHIDDREDDGQKLRCKGQIKRHTKDAISDAQMISIM